MAAALDTRCPICLDTWGSPAFTVPRCHQCCLPCIQRWAVTKPECKRRLTAIVHSVQADDKFEELVISPSAAASIDAVSSSEAQAAWPWAAWVAPSPLVGGLPADTWGHLFREHPALLRPLLSWVRRELRRICQTRRSAALHFENAVRETLRLVGLEEEMLLQLVEDDLGENAAPFVRHLLDVAVQRCSREAHRLLGLNVPPAAELGRPAPGQKPAHPAPTEWLLHLCPLSILPAPAGMRCPAHQEMPFEGMPAALTPRQLRSPWSRQHLKRSHSRALHRQAGQGLPTWGSPASPQEEDQLLPGLCTTQEEATPPRTIEAPPRPGPDTRRPQRTRRSSGFDSTTQKKKKKITGNLSVAQTAEWSLGHCHPHPCCFLLPFPMPCPLFALLRCCPDSTHCPAPACVSTATPRKGFPAWGLQPSPLPDSITPAWPPPHRSLCARGWGSALLPACTAAVVQPWWHPDGSCAVTAWCCCSRGHLGLCPAQARTPSCSTTGRANCCTWGGTSPALGRAGGTRLERTLSCAHPSPCPTAGTSASPWPGATCSPSPRAGRERAEK